MRKTEKHNYMTLKNSYQNHNRLIDDLVERALVVTVDVSSSVCNTYNKLVRVLDLSLFTELWWTEAALWHYNQHLPHSALEKFRTSCQCVLFQSLLKL